MTILLFQYLALFVFVGFKMRCIKQHRIFNCFYTLPVIAFQIGNRSTLHKEIYTIYIYIYTTASSLVCNCNRIAWHFEIATCTEQSHNINSFQMVTSSAFKARDCGFFLLHTKMTDDVIHRTGFYASERAR